MSPEEKLRQLPESFAFHNFAVAHLHVFLTYILFHRLPDLLKLEVLLAIAASVEVLHGFYNLAHLDLRLPNIAFQTYTDTTAKRRFMVKLIDFDRAQEVKCKDAHDGTWPGQIMYLKGSTQCRGTWNSGNQDWLQLAVLIMMALRPDRYICVCVCVCACVCASNYPSFLADSARLYRGIRFICITKLHSHRFAVTSMDDFNDKAKNDFKTFLAIDDPAVPPTDEQKEQLDTSFPAVDTATADSSEPSLGTFAKGSFAKFFHNELIQHLLRGESSCSVNNRNVQCYSHLLNLVMSLTHTLSHTHTYTHTHTHTHIYENTCMNAYFQTFTLQERARFD